MTPSEELNSIYDRIGNGETITDELEARIKQLEDLINPFPSYQCDSAAQEVGCGCGRPMYCWDCAAIIGGCPEDA